MAIDPRKEAAWKSAFEKGSKRIQSNLRKIHAKNPEFQEFVNKHGFGVTLSKKKAENQSAKRPPSSPTVKPTSPAHPEAKKGPVDRLAMIKAAQEKRKLRNQAASNRIAWGGELGGSFQMPGNSFRRYSESLEEARKKRVMGFDMTLQKPPQLPAPKGGHPVPKGYERIKDSHGTNVLRKKVAERFELMKPILAEGSQDDMSSWDSAIVRTRFGRIKTPKAKKDRFMNKLRRVARKKIKKVLATEYTEMSSKEALQELKKATYASYLQKAPQRVRSGTSLAKGFEDDYYGHLSKALKHSPNVLTFDPEKEKAKDPEKLKHHEGQMKIAKDLQTDFARGAKNRIKGIQRAGRLLSKEEVEDVLSETNTLARPEIWKTHELRHDETGKVFKKGDKVKDFRGDEHEILGFAPPHKESSSGRVHTDQGVFFPGVVGATIHKKSAVKEGFVGLYKAKRQAMFEAKTKETVAPEVVEEEQQVVEEVRKPDYRDVRRALIRKGK